MKSLFIVKRWLFLLALLALLLPVVAQDPEPLPLPPAGDDSGIALPALEEEPTPAPQPAFPPADGGVRAPAGTVIEMLQNGGYEIGDPATSYKLPLHWTGVNLLTPDRLRCNTPTLTFSQSGECAFRFNVTNSNVNRRIASVATFYGPSTGGRIDISVAVKGTDITGGVVSVKFGFLDGEIQKDKIRLPLGTYDYQTLSKTYWMPKTLAWIRVAVGPNGYGSLLVDNASLLFTPPGPVVVNDTYTILRNESLTTTLTNGLFANDTLNGATLQSYTQPASGTVIVNADGTFTYTPPSPTFTGAETFTYTVASTAGSATGTATILVNPNAPVAVDDTYPDVIINTPFIQPPAGVLANDTVEGATLSLSSTTGSAGGTLNLSADGSFTYTPPANFPPSGPSGNDTFTYTLSNVTGFDSATITFTVNAVPVAVDDAYDVYRDATGVYASSGSVVANDALNGGAVTTGVIPTTLGGSVIMAPDGTFTYTLAPTAGLTQMNVDSFTYQISNAYANDTATVTLNVYPMIPVAVDDEYDDVVINTPYSVPAAGVLTNDTPNGGVLALLDTTGSQGGTLSLNADGSFTYTPPADFPVGVATGIETFAYTLTNVTGSDGATITLTVNRVPIAVDDTYDVYRDASGIYTSSAPVTVNDTLNGGTVTAATIPTTLGGSVTIDAGGNFTYTLAASAGLTQVDIDTFSYTLSSAYGSDTATVTLNVYPMAPVAVDDDYDDVVINTPYSVPASGVLTNDTPRGGTLTLMSTTGTAGGTLSLSADGSFTYTPPANFPASGLNAVDSFSYTLTNITGSDDATITFTVNAIPIAVDDEYNVYRDNGPEYFSTVPLTANDTLNGGMIPPLTTITTAMGGMVVVFPDGAFYYLMPAAAGMTQVDVDTFSYPLTNAYGSDTATVTLNVYPRTPVAVDDDYIATKGTPLTVNAAAGVLANDTAYGAVISTFDDSGLLGTLSFNTSDGSFTYTPPLTTPTREYVDSFTYTLTNATGSDTATVEITVRPPAPVAVDDEYNVLHNAVLTVAAPGFLDNDTLNEATVTVGTLTGAGTLSASIDGSFTYTPAAAPPYAYSVTFDYTLAHEGGSDTGTVTINVAPAAPTAADDSLMTYRDTPLTIDEATDLLANDTLYSATISAPAVATPVATSKGGSITRNANGTFTYTPPAGFVSADANDVDTFTYTVTNVTGSDSATVAILVLIPPPTAVDDAYDAAPHISLDVPAANGLLANDTLESGTLTTTGTVTTTKGGTVIIAADGSFVYHPPVTLANDTDTFTYTLENSTGDDTATVTITLLNKELIWFVDASAPASGDGTHHKPFNTLSSLNAALTDNDLVYIFANASAYNTTTALSLKSGQKVYGQEVDLDTVADWLPDYSIVPLTGARPTLTSTGAGIHLFSLNTNNTFAGFNVGATGGYAFYGPAAVTAGTVKISTVSKSVAGGGAIALLNGGTMDIVFGDVRGTTAGNLPAFHFKSTTGTFTVTAAITTAGGGVSGALTPAFHVENSTATYALTGVNIANSGGAGIRFASSGARGTLNVTGPSNTVSATFGFALDLAYTTLNASFQRLFANDPAQGGVNLFYPQGTLNVSEFDVITPNNAMLEMFQPTGTYTFGSSGAVSNFTPKPITYGANAGLVIVKGGTATLNLNNLQIEQATFTGGPTGTTTTNIVYLEGAGGDVTIDKVATSYRVNGAAIKINNGTTLGSNTITLKDGTFNGLYNLLWAEYAGNAVISDTTVASTDDDGIYFHNSRNLTLTNVTINSIGDASGDYALDLKDTRIGGVKREITITNSNFRDMAHHGLFAEMSTATYEIKISSGEFASMTTKTACGGVSCAGTAIVASSLVTAASYSPLVDVAVTNTNFLQYGNRAIHVEAVNAAGGSPDVKLTVSGGTFTGSTGAVNSSYGISVNTAGANTEAVFSVTGAQFNNNFINALAVNADGSNATVSGKFNTNTVTGAGGQYGVFITNNPVNLTDASNVRVQMMNNVFNNTGVNVVLTGSTNGTTVMDVATMNNMFNGGTGGIRYVNNQSAGTVCAFISGNNVSAVTPPTAIAVRNQLTGAFNIEGLSGTANSYLSSVNTMGINSVNAFGIFGAANCQSDTM